MSENLHGLNLRNVVYGLDSESRPWRPPIPQDVKERVIDFVEWIYPFHLFPSELESEFIDLSSGPKVDIILRFHFQGSPFTNHVLVRFTSDATYVQVEENNSIGLFRFNTTQNFRDIAMIVLNVRSRSTGK